MHASGTVETLDLRVSTSSDDAEERNSGRMYLDSSDLELVFDRGAQTVGIRFMGVSIPQGSEIRKAHVQFRVDERSTRDTSLTIRGEARDDAPTFGRQRYDVSRRALTAASTQWAPEPWPTKYEAGSAQRTPDVAALIQEIVNRPGWESGNAIALIITGTGERTADSYDGDPDSAPVLHIEFVAEQPTIDQAPANSDTLNAGEPSAESEPESAGDATAESGSASGSGDNATHSDVEQPLTDAGGDSPASTDELTPAQTGAETAEAGALPAFPGAEGFGAHTVGGRGGRVYLVTSLNDSGPGTLRECAQAQGPRICVFRTAGLITLNSSIEIESPYITIAGQSAPGGGIAIRTRADYPKAAVKVKTHDVIIRYLRIRPGASHVMGDTQDAITIANLFEPVYNVIIDHSSLSWASDEVAQVWYDARDITFQWNIISEGLDCMNHTKGCNHSKGLLVGSDGSHSVSVHHNLFAHHSERNPRIAMSGIADVVGNVMYNPQYSASQTTTEHGPAQVNYIGNYMKKGVNSQSDYMISPKRYEDYPFELFVKGNISEERPNTTLDETLVVKPRDYQWESDTRHAAPPVTLQGCDSLDDCDLFDVVLRHAGATLPKRDAVDQRIVAEVKSGSGKIIDAQSARACYLDCRIHLRPEDYRVHGIQDPLTEDGWPVLDPGHPYGDADRDGMSDDWERAYGLDATRNDSAGNDLHPGYTNIEVFLNDLAAYSG